MWWTRRKPAQLTAPCRDVAGRKREILVFPTEDRRVALTFPSGEIAVLEPLQAGRLRSALRDVVLALGDATARDQHQHAIPTLGARRDTQERQQ